MPRSWVYSINSCPSTPWQVSSIGMIGLRIQAARWNRIARIYFYFFYLASDGWPWSEWSLSNSSTKLYAGILSEPYVTRRRYLGFHILESFVMWTAFCMKHIVTSELRKNISIWFLLQDEGTRCILNHWRWGIPWMNIIFLLGGRTVFYVALHCSIVISCLAIFCLYLWFGRSI